MVVSMVRAEGTTDDLQDMTLRGVFAKQFTPHGDGFLYRRDSVGPGIPVTAKERAQFLRAHEKYCFLRARLAAITAVFLLAGLMLLRSAWPWAEAHPAIFFLLLLAIGPVFLGKRPEDDPDRALANRQPVRPPLSEDERKRMRRSERKYVDISLPAASAAMFLFHQSLARLWRDEPLWGKAWLFFAMATAVAVLVWAPTAAYRKWRFQRSEEGAEA